MCHHVDRITGELLFSTGWSEEGKIKQRHKGGEGKGYTNNLGGGGGMVPSGQNIKFSGPYYVFKEQQVAVVEQRVRSEQREKTGRKSG